MTLGGNLRAARFVPIPLVARVAGLCPDLRLFCCSDVPPTSSLLFSAGTKALRCSRGVFSSAVKINQ